MQNRRGTAILVIIMGLVLLEVLGNVFVERVGTYSYYFLPFPLLGTYLLFRERRKRTPQYESSLNLSLVLMMLHFIGSLGIALLYNYYLHQHVNLRMALNMIYLSKGIALLLFSSVLVAAAGASFHKRPRCFTALLIIVMFLVIVSVVRVDEPARTMMDDIENIRQDEYIGDSQKSILVTESINEYNHSAKKYISGLALALAGLIAIFVIIIAERDELEKYFLELKKRIKTECK